MIGKIVSIDEIQPLLDKKEQRGEFEAQLRAEVGAIKKGQCLRYECKEGESSIQKAALQLLLIDFKGLELAASGNFAYIYRK